MGNNKLIFGFIIFISAIMLIPSIHDQKAFGEDNIIWDNGSADIGWNQLGSNISADDFQLEQDTLVSGAHFWPCRIGTQVWDVPVQWYVYDDDSGKPGTMLFNGDGINIVGEFTFTQHVQSCNEFEVSFDLDNPPSLESGIDYWFGFHAGPDGVYDLGINIFNWFSV